MSFARAAIFLLALCCPSFATAERVPEDNAQRVEALVKGLPQRSEVRHYQQQRGVATRDGRDAEVLRLQGEIDKVAKIVKELRPLLKPGTSIFEYPGLLAAGEITYVILSGPDPFSASTGTETKTARGYALDIGVPLVTHKEFRVLFDERGLITEIRTVPNKR